MQAINSRHVLLLGFIYLPQTTLINAQLFPVLGFKLNRQRYICPSEMQIKGEQYGRKV